MTADAAVRLRMLDQAQDLRRRAAELERAAAAAGPSDSEWIVVLHGDWTTIRRGAARRLDSARATDGPAADDHLAVAVSSALLGDVGAARTAADDAETLARADVHTLRAVRFARSVAHLVAGAADSARALLTDLAATAEGPAFAGIGLLAESAFRSRHTDAVRPLLELADSSTPAAFRDEMAVARAFLGLPSPESSQAVRSTFARARVELATGMRRRRARDEIAARPHLVTALDLFGNVGAAPWTSVAANELRASGHRVAGSGARLTEQQVVIAELAARGLTNRQIADRLCLSPRTVGTHLYRTFPKLGITSRHQLRSALGRARGHLVLPGRDPRPLP